MGLCSDAQSCLTLSMGFSRQEYWSGLPCPSPGDLPDPEIEPVSPALGGGFFATSTTWGIKTQEDDQGNTQMQSQKPGSATGLEIHQCHERAERRLYNVDTGLTSGGKLGMKW